MTESKSGGKTNKLISVLLSIVILVNIVPLSVGPAAAAGPEYSGTSLAYNFCARSAEWVHPTLDDNRNISGITYEFTDGKWQWRSSSFTPAHKTGYNWNATRTDLTITADNRWVALELDVPETLIGKNHAVFGILCTDGGGIANVYFLPDSAAGSNSAITSAVSSNTYLIGELDCSLETSGIINRAVKMDVPVEIPAAGKYVLVFKRKNIDVGRITLLQSLTLDGTDKPTKAVNVSAAATETELAVGETAEINAAAYSEYGYPVQIDSIEYQSGNPEIATVDNNGIVTAVSDGIATISVDIVAGDIEETINIYFLVGNVPYSGKRDVFDFRVRSAEWVHPIQTDNRNIDGITYEYTDGKWQWHSSSFTPVDRSAHNLDGDRINLKLDANGDWAAFELDIDGNLVGRNIAIFEVLRTRGGGLSGIYLMPAGVAISKTAITEALMDDKYYIGDMDCSTSIGESYDDAIQLANIVTIPGAGKYVLVIKQKNATLGKTMLFRTLRFDGTEESVGLHEFEISTDKEVLTKGDTAKIILNAKSENGLNVSLDEVTYESDNPLVAPVDGNGVITNLETGTATITATASAGGITKTASLAIEVVTLALDTVELKFTNPVIPVGETTECVVTCRMNNGSSADLQHVELSFSSDNTQAATVDGQGVITAHASGNAHITVTAVLDGVTVSGSAEIAVKGAVDYTGASESYNFTYRRDNWISPITLKDTDVLGITREYTEGNWQWGAANFEPRSGVAVQSKLNYLSISLESGEWAALEIDISDAGKYLANMLYNKSASGGEADLYLIPKLISNVPDGMTESYLLGRINSKGEAAENYSAIFANPIEIPYAGSYYLVIKPVAENTGKIYLKRLQLSGYPEAAVFSEVKLFIAGNMLQINGTSALGITCLTQAGWPIELDGAQIEYASSNEDVVYVDSSGVLHGKGVGTSLITAAVRYEGITVEGELLVTVGSFKTRRSFYTDEKIANARENIRKYSWAESKKKSAANKADEYVGKEELLWNLVTTQELPRPATVAMKNDPKTDYCPYCNVHLRPKYGGTPWITNILSDPWKIKCPDCKRRFPSNDFGNYYKTGIDEYGNWNYELAKENGQEFLVNKLYPEKGDGWAVDDGYGYKSGFVHPNGIEDVRLYIGYYNHYGIWRNGFGILPDALSSLRDAYLLTGESKYGRAGAILMDRIADVYPEMDTSAFTGYSHSDGGSGLGKLVGCIADSSQSRDLALAYDAFWPAMDDPYVISFLSQKAEKYRMNNPKTHPQLIRANCDDGILRQIYIAVQDGSIRGNFGRYQEALAYAAVILDTLPETGEWIDFIFQSGDTSSQGCNVYAQIVEEVDRDGFGNEASPSYNRGWTVNLLSTAEVLKGYDKYPQADLYSHPKMQQMLRSSINLTLCSRFTPTIADSGTMGQDKTVYLPEHLRIVFNAIGDINAAKLLYYANGEKKDGINDGIYAKNPEAIQDAIENAIAENAALNLKSANLAGYGFAALRAGAFIRATNPQNVGDTQRDFWMYYGRSDAAHAHNDKLNLGIHAYGLDIAPDLGYPENSGANPQRLEWISQTLSHNTVTVNKASQKETTSAIPKHFDDAGKVKLMDVEASSAYNEASVYRRTLVMVDVNDDVSYGVDFFRVKGGNDHLYSFHALSEEAVVEGVTLQKQEGGSYAGVNVPWGEEQPGATHPKGYNWLRNVERADNPGTGTFSADWKIKDFWKVLPVTLNLHLRLTMVNDFDLSEVTLADGAPPRVPGNPTDVKYILARRTGNNLDSLFTAVLEPYKNNRYLESIQAVPVEIAGGTEKPEDAVKAVKVRHVDGREDYIVYATNNSVLYRVDGLFDFRGFVGVYCVSDGENVYSYVNDGDVIGGASGIRKRLTGTVTGFTEEMSSSNKIIISPDEEIAPEVLRGKYIYVDNGGDKSGDKYNGCYEILDAAASPQGIELDIGPVTLIKAYKNKYSFNMGYVYNIAKGQRFNIPLNYYDDAAPVFEPLGEYSVDVKSNLRFQVKAVSPLTDSLNYSATVLPRGAAFDSKSRTFSWTPENNQTGAHIVGFKASDGKRNAYVKGIINVTGATVSKKPDNQNGGSGGGQDSGAGSVTPPPVNQDTQNGNTGGSVSGGFTDLDGYGWAKNAIDTLHERGIINGTGHNIFSPGRRITRADFVILLVRAFNLTSDAGDGFSDVDDSKYYAKELAIAKANGIIAGMGNNMFYPEKEISRQEIMLILYRVLTGQGYELIPGTDDAIKPYSDASSISDYALDAVRALIANEIVLGSGDRINPGSAATRAEVAVLLLRILEMKKQA